MLASIHPESLPSFHFKILGPSPISNDFNLPDKKENKILVGWASYFSFGYWKSGKKNCPKKVFRESMIVFWEIMIVSQGGMIVFWEIMIVFHESMMVFWDSMIVFRGIIMVVWKSMVVFRESMIVFQESNMVFRDSVILFRGIIIVFREIIIVFQKIMIVFREIMIVFWESMMVFRGIMMVFREIMIVFWDQRWMDHPLRLWISDHWVRGEVGDGLWWGWAALGNSLTDYRSGRENCIEKYSRDHVQVVLTRCSYTMLHLLLVC